MIFKDRIGAPSKREITEEGYLLIKDARIARVGVQPYLVSELPGGADAFPGKEPTDILNVYRDAAGVFDPVSLKSFELQPITDDHPPGGVTAKNYAELAVGVAANVRADKHFVLADLKITDPKVVKKIESGKTQLSNGYSADLIIEPGRTPEGLHYDAKQVNIRGNHIALVDQARCGPACSLTDHTTIVPETSPMRVMINKVPFTISDESLFAAVQKLISDNETLEGELETAQDENIELTKLADMPEKMTALEEQLAAAKEEVQRLQAQLDQAKANEMTPDKLDEVISDRMAIVAAAHRVLPKLDPKGKTCMAIKREVLQAKFGDSISEEKLKSDVYVDARFDALLDDPKTEFRLTPTETLLRDSAERGLPSVSGSALARQKKIITGRIAHQFPVGASRPGHKDFGKFRDALNSELAKLR